MNWETLLVTIFYPSYRLEVPQQQVWSILTLMLSPDSLEDLTSISKRERTLNQVVVSTPRREDIIGPLKLWEETPPEPVEWDLSDTSPERWRMAGEAELKPPRRWRHERVSRDTLFPHYLNAIHPKIVLKLS